MNIHTGTGREARNINEKIKVEETNKKQLVVLDQSREITEQHQNGGETDEQKPLFLHWLYMMGDYE